MSDRVITGEADAQEIRLGTIAQVFGVDRLPGKIEQQIVAKRRIAQGLIIRRREFVLAASKGMREGAALTIAVALAPLIIGSAVQRVVQVGPESPPAQPEPAIRRPRAVKVNQPRMKPRAIIGGSDKQTRSRVKPVASVRMTAGGKDCGTVLQR